MKIIFVSAASDFTDQIIKGFHDHGVNLIWIDDRAGNRLLWKIIRRVRPIRRLANWLFNRRLIAKLKIHKPDVLFINKGMTTWPETLIQAKELRIKTVNWFPDNAKNEPYHSWVKRVGPIYDYFFGFDSSMQEYFTGANAGKFFYVPFAMDPNWFSPRELTEAEKEKYSADVCFIGAPYPDRIELLSLVKDKNLKIFGWQGWENTALAAYYHGPLSAQESAKAYSIAKICVNTNIQPPISGVNMKTFEIPAAGGFQLSDYRSDVEQLFVIDKEIIIFHDLQEFQNKVRYYLEHDTERQAIAIAGHKRFLENHTLDRRVGQILEIIK
jgi:spore maturation protein CgeB